MYIYIYIYHLGQKSPDKEKAAHPSANSAIAAPLAVVTKKWNISGVHPKDINNVMMG